MIQAIVVDDQNSFLKSFRQLVEENFSKGLRIISSCHNLREAVHAINTYNPELIFLDVELGDESGFDLLEQFPDPQFSVIFTTAHENYAIRALRFSAIDYLLKPFGAEDLERALSRYENATGPARLMQRMELLHQNMKVLGDPHKKLALPTLHGFEVVELKDIICLCSSSNYTTFTLIGGREMVISHPLREYEELLEEYNFFRIHQSYMINMDHVKKYVKTDGGIVVLSNGKNLEVSRRKREEFLKRMNLIS